MQSGQASEIMMRNLGELDTQRALEMFADWTDRIARGELPKAKPPRPQGVERNVVVTLWDWATPKAYLHDEIATDKRNPTVNANGMIYGSPEDSTDFMPILDPVHQHGDAKSKCRCAIRRRPTPWRSHTDALMLAPSPYWGTERIWDSQTTVHNPMFDEKGRVWFTARIRPPDNPAFCKKGSDHPSAKLFPVERAGRQLAMYDPKTQKFTLIDTCFSTHHLAFAEDANNTLWLSSGGAAQRCSGWLNRKKFDETGDEQKSQGWTPFVLDTNGNGKRDEYVEPNQPVDPTKDKRIVAGFYGIGVNPNDGSIWGSVLGFPGAVIRVVPGDNPPATALTEYYEVPWTNRGPRSMAMGRAAWTSTAMASSGCRWRAAIWRASTARKCKGPLNGPTGDRQALSGRLDALSISRTAVPRTVTDSGSAQASYYTWVDQFDTFGLGKNVPIATGNLADSLEALVDGKFVDLARALSDGLLRQGHGRPDRRSERRLEGQGTVVDLRRQGDPSHRRRQGGETQGGEVSVAARSVGEMNSFTAESPVVILESI